MNPKQFRRIRERAELTWAQLAAFLRIEWRSVARYELGERKIPGPVEVLMELLASGELPAEAEAQRGARPPRGRKGGAR